MQQELFQNEVKEQLIEKRKSLLGESWYEQLGQEFNKSYMQSISQFLADRRSKVAVYPEPQDVFRAYQLTPYDKVKVVIIAQDPYNDGTATGVAMGVKNPQLYPKTVDVLDIAIADDLYEGLRLQPIDPDLEYLCVQGVLLINSYLTVEHKNPKSHSHIGWPKFIEATIEALNKKDLVIYLLWGSDAQKFKKFISDAHVVLEAEHPIKHKYEKRPNWIHHRPFSKTNQLLINNKQSPINW